MRTGDSSVKARLEYLIKHNILVQWLYRHLMSAVFHVVGVFVPFDENAALFTSFSGKRYDDSPRAVFEEMLRRDDCKGLHYVWAFNEPEKFDVPKARKVKMDSWAYWMACLGSKYWVTNVNMERGLNIKKRPTIYVNTWHGTGAKKVGNSVGGRSDYDFSRVDILTCDGLFLAKLMEKSFNARRDSMLMCGRPREDELYSLIESRTMQEVRAKMGLDSSKRSILYAPTWRESGDRGETYDMRIPMNIEKWKRALGADTLLLFRAHSITSAVQGIEFDEQVKDFSTYSDLNELMFVSDVLISDYSGIYTDFAIQGKPMLGFMYDFDDYSEERGFEFDLREYITSFDNEDDLLEYINSMDVAEESAKARRYFQIFAGSGGNATTECIDRMLALGRRLSATRPVCDLRKTSEI